MRTATDYRAVLERWRATAPANDSALLPRAARPAKPRHRDLADQFRGLLAWRAMNEAAERPPLSTNWLGAYVPPAAANDDEEAEADVDELHPEVVREIRPTVGEIMRALKDVAVEWRAETRIIDGVRVTDGRFVVVGGDVDRDDDGRPVRLGGVRIVGPELDRRLQIQGSRGGWFNESERAVEKTVPQGYAATPLLVRDEGSEHRPESRREVSDLRSRLGAHAAILDAALQASSFADIGRTLGFAGKVAERRGREALLSACAAFDAAIGLLSEAA